MTTKYEITGFDIEAISNIIRGLTYHPDLVDDDDLEKLVKLLQMTSTATIYSH
jgi:hypothetical protein